MAEFNINETQVTTVNRIEVATESASPVPRVAAAATLKPGVHRFQLVVEDNDGNVSQPFFVDVLVRPRQLVVDRTPGPVRPFGRGGISGPVRLKPI